MCSGRATCCPCELWNEVRDIEQETGIKWNTNRPHCRALGRGCWRPTGGREAPSHGSASLSPCLGSGEGKS